MPRKPKQKSVTKGEMPVIKTGKRGGPRIGAGRPPGSVHKRLLGVREITSDIIKSGKVPLRVMINNMLYYDEQAGYLEEQFADAMKDFHGKFSEAGFIKALELFSQISDTRMKSQRCAVDAAPFIHPRLSQMTMDVNTTHHPRDLPADAPIEAAREDFRRMRSAPLIEQPDVEVESEDAE
jgi:hypothetical protein